MMLWVIDCYLFRPFTLQLLTGDSDVAGQAMPFLNQPAAEMHPLVAAAYRAVLEDNSDTEESETNSPRKIPPPEGKFKCEKCPRLFTRIHNMQVHMQEVHENRRKFACHRCMRMFTRKYALNRHLLSCRQGEGEDQEEPSAGTSEQQMSQIFLSKMLP